MRARFIPVLSLDRRRRLVKTIGFGGRTYIGDPFNVIRLFNEKEVDEIVVLDIDASVDQRLPDPGFLNELASECFIPLSYGGGLTNVGMCEQLSRLGIEKFVIGSASRELEFISTLSRTVGAQSVVGCVDARGEGDRARAYVQSAQLELGVSAIDQARRLEDAGCGEIILQSVDRDGIRQGLNLGLISAAARKLSVPLIALGGAGTYQHLSDAIAAGASAAASGSAFAFVGRLRAVLINYPPPDDIETLSLAQERRP